MQKTSENHKKCVVIVLRSEESSVILLECSSSRKNNQKTEMMDEHIKIRLFLRVFRMLTHDCVVKGKRKQKNKSNDEEKYFMHES